MKKEEEHIEIPMPKPVIIEAEALATRNPQQNLSDRPKTEPDFSNISLDHGEDKNDDVVVARF